MPDYGRVHKALRRQLLGSYIAGITRCARCGEPITETDTRKIHLDHLDDGTGWAGLAHASCNESAGASKGNRQGAPRGYYARRARRPRGSRAW